MRFTFRYLRATDTFTVTRPLLRGTMRASQLIRLLDLRALELDLYGATTLRVSREQAKAIREAIRY